MVFLFFFISGVYIIEGKNNTLLLNTNYQFDTSNLNPDGKMLSNDLTNLYVATCESQDSHNWLRDQDSNLEPNG